MNYVLNFVFKEVLNVAYEIFTELPSSHERIHVNYSLQNADSDACHIPVSGFLQDFKFGEVEGTGEGATFRMFTSQSGEGFDVFAMIFYCLSRYEEYFITDRDEIGRITFENFASVKNKFHDLPLVDILIIDFYNKLRENYTDLPEFHPTTSKLAGIDIDSMYLHAHRSPVRYFGSLVKSVLKGDISNLISVLKSKSADFTDPYTFHENWMAPVRDTDTRLNVFILTAMQRRGHDKNLDPNHPAFRQWLSALYDKYKVDYQWHPSLQSNSDFKILSEEKAFLEKIVKNKITKSRQHFLYFVLPETYRNLLRLGIREEHSMGFYDRAGYRASTAYPHQWYDLKAERMTDLRIYPFVVMDVQLLKYMKVDADQAVGLISEIKRKQQETGGIFSFIWHNSSFLEADGWKGWEKVYQAMVQ